MKTTTANIGLAKWRATHKTLQKMRLVQPRNCLSVMPVEKTECEEIVKHGK
ncbi:MAG: hypothetical protein WCZ90_05215 [Melioribacteraceae bacterium]